MLGRNSSQIPLPDGYILERDKPPNPAALNRLFSRCNQSTYSQKKLALALERSIFLLSILQKDNGLLAGFVRATTDDGLNANLWNLSARPGDDQAELLRVLVNRSLFILRKESPGCSISVSAPLITLTALEDQGFLIDPGGIRAMGLRL